MVSLVLNEWHPWIIIQFYHGARVEEVQLADLRGKDGETIALYRNRNFILTADGAYADLLKNVMTDERRARACIPAGEARGDC